MLEILFISSALLLLFEGALLFLVRSHRDAPPKSTPALSILITAHNERAKLEKKLPLVLQSMRPGDELIVVDDGSEDGSYRSLLEMSAENPIVLVRNFARQGKKRAIGIGCRKATHPFILQTDADCHPRSPEWVDRMRGPLAQGYGTVLGWGALEKRPGLLNAFLRYESARTALSYSAFQRIGAPYMGVGRNLLYRKAERLEGEMPESYHRILSGDDDLFIAHRAKASDTSLITHPTAHTLASPPESWRAYWHQRRRHSEAGLHYPLRTLIPLGLLDLSELLFFFSAFWTLITPGQRLIGASALLALLFFRSIVTGLASNSLVSGTLTPATPLFSLMSLMKRIFVDISVLLSKPTRWQ